MTRIYDNWSKAEGNWMIRWWYKAEFTDGDGRGFELEMTVEKPHKVGALIV